MKIIYDETLQISTTFLQKEGLIKYDAVNGTSIAWKLKGELAGIIYIVVNTRNGHSFIELEYYYKNHLIKYNVDLINFPSNIGKGEVWYFVCPKTGKRCRKLYLANGFFYHRLANEGHYKGDILSRKERVKRAYNKKLWQTENFKEGKHFKVFYAGKPTKRYLKLTTGVGTYCGN